jgi:hypothetical protein
MQDPIQEKCNSLHRRVVVGSRREFFVGIALLSARCSSICLFPPRIALASGIINWCAELDLMLPPDYNLRHVFDFLIW